MAALALAVDPVVQAEHPEGVLVQPAGQVIRQHPLELLDVGSSSAAIWLVTRPQSSRSIQPILIALDQLL